MNVRPKQMGVFEARSRESFEERLTEHVRTRYAGQKVGTSAGVFRVSELKEECLRAMVRYSIEKAKRHGITWESSTAAFAALMFTVGPRFDEHPDIRGKLDDPEVPDNSRVDHLCYVIPKAKWRDVKQAQGAQAWSSALPTLKFSRQEDKRA